MVLPPKESGKLISCLTKNITISDNGIENLGNVLIREIQSGRLSVENFSQTEVHPKATDPWALEWLFVVDTLNFCFWSMETEVGWTIDGKTGYFALCAAINRAMKDNIDVLNPKFYSSIDERDLRNILRSDNDVEIPLFQERMKCLHETGAVLLERFNGCFENCVKKAENSAVILMHLIVDNFECFRDEAEYKGHKVAIYKRAQILVGDVYSCFKNQGLGYFKDINDITMFADYRIPQALLWWDVFKYSHYLTKKLLYNTILKNGDEEEVEIRGCSIQAVELLKEYVTKRLGDKDVNSILIDHFLWDFRRTYAEEILQRKLPFHKTFCIYY